MQAAAGMSVGAVIDSCLEPRVTIGRFWPTVLLWRPPRRFVRQHRVQVDALKEDFTYPRQPLLRGQAVRPPPTLVAPS